MTTKITWTHVDAHVRKACERTGMLPVGGGDAEVAYKYLRYVEKQADGLQDLLDRKDAEVAWFKSRVRHLEEKALKGKTKRRLGALEKAVAELRLGLAGVATSRVSGAEVNNSNVPKADPFGPRDADGWYTWNGDDTMRPAGMVEVVLADGSSITHPANGLRWSWNRLDSDVVKWRPAQ